MELTLKRELELVWHDQNSKCIPYYVKILTGVDGMTWPDTAQQLLQHELKEINIRNKLDDYLYPSLFPHRGIGVVAEILGAKAKKSDSWDPWIKPYINEPSDVKYIKVVDIDQNLVVRKVLKLINYLQDNGPLNVPLRICNVPSPLTTASLIWGYSEFLTALYIAPVYVHELLNIITETTISFIKTQMKVIKNLFGLTHEEYYIPIEAGLRISDDVLSALSLNHYLEFGVPYNARLGEAFGGLVVHSCGPISHNLKAIQKIDCLTGICCSGNQNKADDLLSLVSNTVTLHLANWDCIGWGLERKEALIKENSDRFSKRGKVLTTILADNWKEAYELARFCRSNLSSDGREVIL